MKRTHSPSRLTVPWLLAGLLLTVGGLGRAASDPIVELPPLLVEESIKALNWRYAEMPGFEMLTVCSDAASRQFAENTHRLEQLLRLLVPERFQAALAVPATHILFDGNVERTVSAEVMEEMVRRERSRTGAEPPRTAGGSRSPLGAMLERRVRFLPNMRLVDHDVTAVFVLLPAASRVEFVFTPERFAYQLERRTPALPPWLLEGLTGLYEKAKFPRDTIVFEPATWLGWTETRALLEDAMSPRTLLPMAELFKVTRGERTKGTVDDSFLQWRAQAALFVRWALAAKEGERRRALWKFVERLETEPLSEVLFRTCFGLGYADVRDRLSDYLPAAVREELTLKAPALEPMPPLPLRPATADEVGRIRGDWERLEINHVKKHYAAAAEKYLAQARRTLQRGYERGTRDPRLLAVYGLCEADWGDRTKARELLEAAVRGGVVRPRAYLELAKLRFKEWTGDRSDARLTGPQTAELLVLLEQGRRQSPPLAETYATIFEVWLRSEAKPSPADLVVVAEGARLFSHLPTVVMRAAYLTANHGRIPDAQKIVELGLSHAADAAVVARYQAARIELAAALAEAPRE